MKRFFFFSAILLGVLSCQKPEPAIDYSAVATLYRVGDNSFVKPIDQPAMGRNSFLCYFCSSPTDREVFILDVALNQSVGKRRGLCTQNSPIRQSLRLRTIGEHQIHREGNPSLYG